MAAITTSHLLSELRHACRHAALVHYIEECIVDIDVLHVKIHLTTPETFINVFYNLDTDKTAFALIQTNQRIYGVDNAKIGWHEHPFANPRQHTACSPITFAAFLQAVEKHLDA